MSNNHDMIGRIVKLLPSLGRPSLGLVSDIVQRLAGKGGDNWASELSGFLNRSSVLFASNLAQQKGLEFVDLDRHTITLETLALLPWELIRRYGVLPLGKEEGKIKILVHDPDDMNLLDKIRFRLNTDISIAVGARGQIEMYVEKVRREVRDEIDRAVRTHEEVFCGLKIGEILRRMGVITEEKLTGVLNFQKLSSVGQKRRFGEILVINGWCTKDDIFLALAAQIGLGFPGRNLALEVMTALTTLLPWETSLAYKCVPLRANGEKGLLVAVANGSDTSGLSKDVRLLMGIELSFQERPPEMIKNFLEVVSQRVRAA